MKRLSYTQQWIEGTLSNFDYLIAVNQIAGRSFQDITQYPVFPWIFNSFPDASADSHNSVSSSHYRDLSLPMGAQNNKRLSLYLDRYQNCLDNNDAVKMEYEELMEDPDDYAQASELLKTVTPPYYYGSHYSTPLGCVLYYLLRLEPYTSMNVQLQDNHFDVADRLFFSAPVALRTCYESLPEVEEAIPEWYFLREFLKNDNQFVFGVKQVGELAISSCRMDRKWTM